MSACECLHAQKSATVCVCVRARMVESMSIYAALILIIHHLASSVEHMVHRAIHYTRDRQVTTYVSACVRVYKQQPCSGS